MKIAPVADVKTHFSEYLKETENGPVVVTRNGRPAAVMIAVGEDEDMAHAARLADLLP